MPSKSTKSVDEVIQGLPKPEQVIVKRLRSLILECLPKAIETASSEIPIYTGNRMICYIWPPSVIWDARINPEKQLAKGVTLGFCRGNMMSNEDGVLLSEGRKQVYVMYFKSLNEIHDNKIKALLFEADMVDESFSKKKKKRD